MNETSRGAGAQSVTVKSTGCRFDPHSRRLNIYLNLYFHFFALVSVEAKRGVEFCHSTRNTSRIRQKVGNGVSGTLGSFSLPCSVRGYSVKLIYFILSK